MARARGGGGGAPEQPATRATAAPPLPLPMLFLLVLATACAPSARALPPRRRLLDDTSVVVGGDPHHPHAAMPWAAPPEVHLPWEGLQHDLDKLVEVMAGPPELHNSTYADLAGPQGDARLQLRWITMLTMTGALRRFAANCIYSLVTYGRQPHYVVATFDASSAAECARMRLPCVNAKPFMPNHDLEDGQHLFGSAAASAIWWAKQRLAHHLLGKNLTVHGTDIDVVYYRDVRKSYSRAFTMLRADAVFASEEGLDEWQPFPRDGYINHMNAGVYAVQPNQRTMDFFAAWINGSTDPRSGGNDQIVLNKLILRSYALCYSHTQCRLTQLQGMMAVWKHPHFWPHTSCIQGSLGEEGAHCDKRRMYLHFLCEAGWHVKTQSWDRLANWLVDEDLKSMYADGGGPHGPHPHLPCANDDGAWDTLDHRID